MLPLLLVAICITPTAAGLPRPDVPFQAVEAAAGQCVMRPGSIETGRRVATRCRGRHVRPIAHLPPLQDPADSTRGPIRSPTGPILKLWLMVLFSTSQSTPCCEKRPNGKTSLAMLLRLPCLKCCMQPSLRPPSDAQELTIGDTPLGFSFADCMPKISGRAAGWPRVDRDTATVCKPARSLECRFGAFFGGSHCRAR